ncbi:MAG TPA: hypothetical protein DHV01_14530 [Rhodoferax sp.]|uniref:hypothetical protein n=1 Tax=Rhodoferax sp. TaxID=50421 RepID=UPI0008BA3D7E|nr:hypothetical protein [Rhodoferax sp.]OGP00221.1 MAG: hypothetical protein A2037_08765 [Curvibacter sp. GWA2_63_95]HCX82800.1 hypothetical protein [Rhodoferax sp.]
MSMPLSINVIIAAATEDAFAELKNIEGLQGTGISPRYWLAAIKQPTSDKVSTFDKAAHYRVGYWIALDEAAFSSCKDVFNQLSTQKGYSRGFYDSHLPNPVVLAHDAKELQEIVNYVLEAFCATS